MYRNIPIIPLNNPGKKIEENTAWYKDPAAEQWVEWMIPFNEN